MAGQDRLQRQLVEALRRHLAGSRRPVVPEAGRLFWGFFTAINESRTYHAAGPEPISYAEIEAWARLNRWRLEPRHVATIRAMDRVWLEHAYAKAEKDDRTTIRIPSHAPAMTPEIFDAVMR